MYLLSIAKKEKSKGVICADCYRSAEEEGGVGDVEAEGGIEHVALNLVLQD